MKQRENYGKDLVKFGADLLVKTMNLIEGGTAPRTKQGEDYTLAPMLNKEMSKIDFDKPIHEIKNKICGLNPIMGAYAMYNNKKIKIWKVEVLDNKEASDILEINITEDIPAGSVLISGDKIGLYLKAKDGVLKVLEVQGENAKRMNINDFLRGNKIEVNMKFT